MFFKLFIKQINKSDEYVNLQRHHRWKPINEEGKQKNEPNVKRILGIYHKGTLQKEIIKGDY